MYLAFLLSLTSTDTVTVICQSLSLHSLMYVIAPLIYKAENINVAQLQNIIFVSGYVPLFIYK